MALVSAYTNPGVTVTEATSPSSATLLPIPNAIAFVGDAKGYKSAIDRAILTGTTDYVLNYTGVDTTSVVVTNITQGLTVDAGNYYLYQSANPTTLTGDEVYSIRRIPSAAAPTISGVSAGTLNNTYVYGVSFVTPSGVTGETAVTAYTASQTLVNQYASLTSVPTGPTGTTARNIYRAIVTGSTVGTFHLVGTISNNTATTYGPDSVSDATAAANPVSKNGIASGDTVTISYNYTDQYYYDPTLFSNYADVEDKYGPAFASDGTISSKLSFAIRQAFLNGASEAIGLAIKNSDLATTLTKLYDIEQIAFVTVASGNTSDHAAVAAHCAAAAANYGLYRQCVVGEDSSSVAIPAATLRTTAQAYNDQNVILISPSSFNITNPVSLKPYAIGAQYAAAAVLGMFAARDATVSLTRKTVAGFLSPNETRTISEAAADSAAGLFVIEYKGNIFRVRHGVTTAVSDVNKRESSVVRAKYALAYELKNGLDGLIGMVTSTTEAPLIVNSAANSILSQLVASGLIGSYQNLATRLLANPTTVEVRFEYTPLYPINNINVVFTINTQTGGFALTQL